MRLDPIEKWNLGFSASAVAVAWGLGSAHFASSLALGAGFGALNFRALLTATQMMFAGQLAGSGPWVALFSLRFVALAAAIGFSLHAGAHAVALVIGLSMVMPATLVAAWRMRPAVVPDAPALDPDDPEWDRWNAWRASEVAPRDVWDESEEDDA